MSTAASLPEIFMHFPESELSLTVTSACIPISESSVLTNSTPMSTGWISRITFTFAGASPNPKKPFLGSAITSYVTLSAVVPSSFAPLSTAASIVFPIAVYSFLTLCDHAFRKISGFFYFPDLFLSFFVFLSGLSSLSSGASPCALSAALGESPSSEAPSGSFLRSDGTGAVS